MVSMFPFDSESGNIHDNLYIFCKRMIIGGKQMKLDEMKKNKNPFISTI